MKESLCYLFFFKGFLFLFPICVAGVHSLKMPWLSLVGIHLVVLCCERSLKRYAKLSITQLLKIRSEINFLVQPFRFNIVKTEDLQQIYFDEFKWYCPCWNYYGTPWDLILVLTDRPAWSTLDMWCILKIRLQNLDGYNWLTCLGMKLLQSSMQSRVAW